MVACLVEGTPACVVLCVGVCSLPEMVNVMVVVMTRTIYRIVRIAIPE